MRRVGKPLGFAGSDSGKTTSTHEVRSRDDSGDGYFTTLPKAVVSDIIALLDGPSVAKLGMTCRRLRDTMKPSSIWRALARAQEPHSSLVRQDLITRNFTWRHLYAWRRHVLSHCENGVDRIAVADQHRVLTCDPVAGGGRSYVVHETPSPATLVPSLLTWSPRGELLAVVQDAPEGCKILVAAPPVTLRERNVNGHQTKNKNNKRRERWSHYDQMGDEDSTAAGYAVGASTFNEGNGIGDGSDSDASVGGELVPIDNRTNDVGDKTVGKKRLRPDREKDAARRNAGHAGPSKPTKLSPLNELTLPVSNPVFLAFAPCGTRLAVMSVQRRGREIALHELDCSVSLFSLYGGANETTRTSVHAVSQNAKETVRLVKASKELSFCYAPRSRDIIGLLDGTQVSLFAPVAESKRTKNHPDDATDDETDLGFGVTPTTSVGTRSQKEKVSVRFLFGLFKRRMGKQSDKDFQTPVGYDALNDDDQEISSAAESLWWRATGDLARDSVRTGVEHVGRGINWCANAVFRGGRADGRQRSARRQGVVSRGVLSHLPFFGGEQRAIKRARLTEKPNRSTQNRAQPENDNLILLDSVYKHRGVIPSKRNVPLERWTARASTQQGSESMTQGFTRHNHLHRAQVEGVLHIVQWIKPPVGAPEGSGAPLVSLSSGMSMSKQSETQPTNPDGFWLVPASFQNEVPPATHLALLPAYSTPGPAVLKGTVEERAEARRRKLLNLPIPIDLQGASEHNATAAASVVAEKSKNLFKPQNLRKHICCELAPPATYQELHAVIPVVASASPGGRIACWSDDVGLWARLAVDPDQNKIGESKPAVAVLHLQTCGFGDTAVDPIGTQNSEVAGGQPVLLHVAAMQWSASGRRLLILLVTHVATASHVVPKYAWAVWDPPSEWLGDKEFPSDDSTQTVGSFSVGRWHVPSASFTNDCLSIFEQYTQTNTMWNPNENQIAYPVRREIHEVDNVGTQFNAVVEEIEIQRFPQTRGWCAVRNVSTDSTEDSSMRQTEHPERTLPFTVCPVEPAVVVCEGSFCAWSPR